MNLKILPYIKKLGFCCEWAFFEAHKATFTSVLMKEHFGPEDGKSVCTLRALQQRRSAYRSGETKCEQLDCCLKKKIRAGHTIP